MRVQCKCCNQFYDIPNVVIEKMIEYVTAKGQGVILSKPNPAIYHKCPRLN